MERLRCERLKDKVMTPKEAAMLFEDDMIVGTSGFTPAGYPKAIPLEIAKRADAGEKIGLTIITGASVGPELDEALTKSKAVDIRIKLQQQ